MKYKKSLGQHILHGEGILKKLVDALGDIKNEIVVEIGGGTGNLTKYLSNSYQIISNNSQIKINDNKKLEISSSSFGNNYGNLIVYELDDDLAKLLKDKFPNTEIKNENFLESDLDQFKNNYFLIGNIPYFITGQILRKIFTLENYPKIAVLTISKEQGKKFMGIPHPNFLSNWIKVWGNIEKICAIKATSFFPPPKIDSIAVKITFYKKPLINDPKNFVRFLKIIFNRPKQTIENNLKKNKKISALINVEDLHLSTYLKLRAHQLTFEKILKLYKIIVNNT